MDTLLSGVAGDHGQALSHGEEVQSRGRRKHVGGTGEFVPHQFRDRPWRHLRDLLPQTRAGEGLGIVGHAANNSRIRGSTASTTEPRPDRSYRGGPSEANALLTVFFEHPITRAITLIGIPSDRRNRRISAQSSTDNTPHIPLP